MTTHRTYQLAAAAIAVILVALLGTAAFLYVKTRSITAVAQESARSYNANDFAGSLEKINAALVKDPKSAQLLIMKAGTLAQEGSINFKEKEYGTQAIQVAQQALAIDPKSDEAWRIIGYANEIMQNYPAAHEAYAKSLALNPKNALTISQEAHAYDLQGDRAKAEAGYTQALAIDPSIDQALMGLGRIHSIDKNTDTAIGYFKYAANTTKNTRIKAEALYSAGVLTGEQGKHADAQILMQTAVTIDPAYPLGWVGLGTEQFAVAADKPLKLTPKQRSELIQASFTSLRKAIGLNAHQTSAYVQLGYEFKSLGKKDVALQMYESAYAVVKNDITLNTADKERFTKVISTMISKK